LQLEAWPRRWGEWTHPQFICQNHSQFGQANEIMRTIQRSVVTKRAFKPDRGLSQGLFWHTYGHESWALKHYYHQCKRQIGIFMKGSRRDASRSVAQLRSS